jgi:hypothetical protein
MMFCENMLYYDKDRKEKHGARQLNEEFGERNGCFRESSPAHFSMPHPSIGFNANMKTRYFGIIEDCSSNPSLLICEFRAVSAGLGDALRVEEPSGEMAFQLSPRGQHIASECFANPGFRRGRVILTGVTFPHLPYYL